MTPTGRGFSESGFFKATNFELTKCVKTSWDTGSVPVAKAIVKALKPYKGSPSSLEGEMLMSFMWSDAHPVAVWAVPREVSQMVR